MLHLFRKYQRIIFICTTIVIVISFSFFGTYNTLNENQREDPVVFTTLNGREVTRSELEEFALFLGSDQEDKLLTGGAWGPNFLNDGVIKNDFLKNGLIEKMTPVFSEEIQEQIIVRHKKEKGYRPYIHPTASFINAENAWNLVVPGLAGRLTQLKQIENPLSEEGMRLRSQLYLEERAFPAPALRMVLNYQGRQYQWVDPDPNFQRKDLALFGYHSLEDWFGPTLMRECAKIVMNGAALAREKGYEVTEGEALADLLHHAQKSFNENQQSPYLGASNPSDYFSMQLNRMGMERSRAVAIWQQVLLFRSLFEDVKHAVFVNRELLQPLAAAGNENVVGVRYSLPEAMQFSNLDQVKKFELYLTAIADRSEMGASLSLPTQFHSVEHVKKQTPELVKKRFLVDFSAVDGKKLGTKVSLRETWSWQEDPEHRAVLIQEFPELASQTIDALDRRTKQRLDAFTRQQIVKEHPEWIDQEFAEGDKKRMVLNVRYKGAVQELGGAITGDQLIQQLERDQTVRIASADGEKFYLIEVIDRAPSDEILIFEEAYQQKVLNRLADQTKEDKRWDDYLRSLKKHIESEYAKDHPEVKLSSFLPEFAASMRLYPHVREEHVRLKNGKEVTLYEENSAPLDEKLSTSPPLEAQFGLVREEVTIKRSAATEKEERDYFSLDEGEWSSLMPKANGAISFFYVDKKMIGETTDSLAESVLAIQEVLGQEALRLFFVEHLNQLY